MHFSAYTQILVGLPLFAVASPVPSNAKGASQAQDEKIAPKVFIINTWKREEDIWRNAEGFNVFEKNITIPGLPPQYPDVHCTQDGSVCQVTVGEGEINAALSTTSLLLSTIFDLRKTYFLISGLASINPKIGTIGSITFAQYALQFGLQHEFDARQIPENFSSGYMAQGSLYPGAKPAFYFGTELYSLNIALRNYMLDIANRVVFNLSDSDAAKVYRALYYSSNTIYLPATYSPSITPCDSITSDTWYTGAKLGDAIEKYVEEFTDGDATYGTASQEDNAILAALFRFSINASDPDVITPSSPSNLELVDFSRVILMRAAGDFDREHWGQSPLQNLLYAEQAKGPALDNIRIVGQEIINVVLEEWYFFEGGVPVGNKVGDVWKYLGVVPNATCQCADKETIMAWKS
ncbi:purine nucleoside permease [Lojkania enalia]|uniref:Purine nucleoside permease n=1 Tax=Lojkania enalia TaxID=147567 RepID=A0A9P4N2K4_9PLEO|nr:purine nucleoside permease [Didymosphaeria enalia]